MPWKTLEEVYEIFTGGVVPSNAIKDSTPYIINGKVYGENKSFMQANDRVKIETMKKFYADKTKVL